MDFFLQQKYLVELIIDNLFVDDLLNFIMINKMIYKKYRYFFFKKHNLENMEPIINVLNKYDKRIIDKLICRKYDNKKRTFNFDNYDNHHKVNNIINSKILRYVVNSHNDNKPYSKIYFKNYDYLYFAHKSVPTIYCRNIVYVKLKYFCNNMQKYLLYFEKSGNNNIDYLVIDRINSIIDIMKSLKLAINKQDYISFCKFIENFIFKNIRLDNSAFLNICIGRTCKIIPKNNCCEHSYSISECEIYGLDNILII